MKALDLLKTNKTITERAENYAGAMKRNIQRDVIDVIVAKREKLEDELFELTNFTLETNVNSGIGQMTKEQCEARFKKIIQIEYDLELLDLELEVKRASFNKYFGEETKTTV